MKRYTLSNGHTGNKEEKVFVCLFYVLLFCLLVTMALLPGETDSRGDCRTPQSHRFVAASVRTCSDHDVHTRNQQHEGRKCTAAAEWTKNLHRQRGPACIEAAFLPG